jgi:hypothetical protein
VVDETRQANHWRIFEEKKAVPHRADGGYVNVDTPLYEQVDRQDGVFNRMLIYRRNFVAFTGGEPPFRARPRSPHRPIVDKRLPGLNFAPIRGHRAGMLRIQREMCCFFFWLRSHKVTRICRPLSPAVP